MDSPRLPSDRTGSQLCHCAPPDGESPPDLSLRGSAGAAAISQYTPGTQESPGEFAGAYLRLPRRACAILAMTREEGTLRFALAPLRVKQAIRFVIARLRRSRGNLAVPGRIVGKPSAKAQLPPRDSHVASLLGMTNLGVSCHKIHALNIASLQGAH